MKVYSETKKKHRNKVISINIFVSRRLLSRSCDVGTKQILIRRYNGWKEKCQKIREKIYIWGRKLGNGIG